MLYVVGSFEKLKGVRGVSGQGGVPEVLRRVGVSKSEAAAAAAERAAPPNPALSKSVDVRGGVGGERYVRRRDERLVFCDTEERLDRLGDRRL